MEWRDQGERFPIAIILAVFDCVSVRGWQRIEGGILKRATCTDRDRAVPALLLRGVGTPGNLRALWNFALIGRRGLQTTLTLISRRKWLATLRPIPHPRFKA